MAAWKWALDHGPQPVRWIGRRMLLGGWSAELIFGESEVLVAARDLECMAGIARCPMPEIDYMHLLLDRHEIVFAEGAPSGSFHPGSWMLDDDRALRAEIEAVFPELAARPTAELLPLVRRIVTAREARVLAV